MTLFDDACHLNINVSGIIAASIVDSANGFFSLSIKRWNFKNVQDVMTFANIQMMIQSFIHTKILLFHAYE